MNPVVARSNDAYEYSLSYMLSSALRDNVGSEVTTG